MTAAEPFAAAHATTATVAEARMFDLQREAVGKLDRIAAAPQPDGRPCFVVRFVRLGPSKPNERQLPVWDAVPVAYPTLDAALSGAADHARLNLNPHAELTAYPKADGTGAMGEAVVPGHAAPLAVYTVEPMFAVAAPGEPA